MRARVRKVELYCHHDGARPVWRVWGLACRVAGRELLQVRGARRRGPVPAAGGGGLGGGPARHRRPPAAGHGFELSSLPVSQRRESVFFSARVLIFRCSCFFIPLLSFLPQMQIFAFIICRWDHTAFDTEQF
jgi:hypothetical protein